MRSESRNPKIEKWPFVTGGLSLLVAAGGLLVFFNNRPETWILTLTLFAFVSGVLINLLPFVLEYLRKSRQINAEDFDSALAKVQGIEKIAELISDATEQWNRNCRSTAKTTATISALIQTGEDRLKTVLQEANDRQLDELQQERDRLQRSNRQWLETLVGILDELFLLQQTAKRTGQHESLQQLETLQQKSLELSHKAGLGQYLAKTGEPFDPRFHRANGNGIPPNPRIKETLVPGFSFQGRCIRLPLVSLNPSSGSAEKAA